MSHAVEIVWQAGSSNFVSSETELVQSLDDLHMQFRVGGERLVLISRTNKSFFCLALGMDGVTTVNTASDDGDPPYYLSLGDARAARSIWLALQGHVSEFPKCSLIPLAAGLAAARYWYRTGRLPIAMCWEEV